MHGRQAAERRDAARIAAQTMVCHAFAGWWAILLRGYHKVGSQMNRVARNPLQSRWPPLSFSCLSPRSVAEMESGRDSERD